MSHKCESKLQKCATLSTTEAKNIAAIEAGDGSWKRDNMDKGFFSKN